jgi:hypothetical protein
MPLPLALWDILPETIIQEDSVWHPRQKFYGKINI